MQTSSYVRQQVKHRCFVCFPVVIALLCVAAVSFGSVSHGETASEEAAQDAEAAGEPAAAAATADPFPDKARVRHARGFTIEYHDGYKKLEVLSPWRDARVTFTYLLTPRGRKVENLPRIPGSIVVEAPVRRMALVSMTNAPFFPMLHIEEALVGIAGCRRINTPSIVERIRRGDISEIGAGIDDGMARQLNMEQLYVLQPDVVVVYGTGIPEYDHHPKLLEAGFRVVMDAGYMESTPLGRTEWIKFLAAFFNKEAEAERIFDEIAQGYEAQAEKVKDVKRRPTVFHGMRFGNVWYMPGGDGYIARFLRDAGADYVWSDDASKGSMPLSMEKVLERARDAEFWLEPRLCRSLEELQGFDDRHGLFRAFRTGRVYNNDAVVSPGGGNDFRETGMARPDLVLADLISIFHPDLAPSHRLTWYRRLPARADGGS